MARVLRGRSMREFFAPLPLLAVALMGLNDHYLKWQFGNAVTGKLSDFAGCFFLPLFTSAVLSLVTSWTLRTRVMVGAALTLLTFGGMKISQPVADASCAGLDAIGRHLGTGCGRIIADPTDLMALPMIVVAVMYGLRRGEASAASAAHL